MLELGHFTRPSKDGTGNVRWVPPQPILRPAFDAKRDRAIQAMGESLAVTLIPEAEKLGMRVGK